MNLEQISLDPRSIEEWHPSVQMVRDAILGLRVMGPNYTGLDLLPAAEGSAPTERDVEAVAIHAIKAVNAGRMYDFGLLPQAMIQHGGKRGGPLWQRRAIDAPFRQPWVVYHTWEGGIGIYLARSTDDILEIVELQPMRVGQLGMLTIGDRGSFFRDLPGAVGKPGYTVSIVPTSMRFVRDPRAAAEINNGDDPYHAASNNIGDPMMTAILLLNTRGVERETVAPSEKLARARMKSGKPPIPAFDRILSAPYVTAITAHRPGPRGPGLGGHHRSPVAHVRQGHDRHYANGKAVFVVDTLVNVPEEQRLAFRATRSHYKVKHP